MRRVRCPSCDKPLKIRDDIQARAVRCPACGEKIPLDEPEAEELEEVEAREEPRPRPSSKGSPARPFLEDDPQPRKNIRSSTDEDDEDDRPEARPRVRKGRKWHAMGTKWHGLLLLLIFVGLSVFLLFVAFVFPRVGGGALGMLGFVTAITGLVMAWGPLRKNGYGRDLAAVPYLLRGGGAFVYLLIRHAMYAPRELACWVTLLIFGLTAMFTGAFFSGRGEYTPPPPVAASAPAAPAVPVQPAAVTGDSQLDALLADLGDGNAPNSLAAAKKLAAMQPDAHQAVVAHKLAGLAKTINPFTREAVIQALGVWATPDEVPVLIGALDGLEPGTRKAALQALGKLRDPRAVGPVIRCLQDGLIQAQAAQALSDMGPMAEKELLPLLNQPDPFLRRTVIGVLKDVGTQQSVAALRPLADGNDVILKQPAQDALAAIAARTNK